MKVRGLILSRLAQIRLYLSLRDRSRGGLGSSDRDGVVDGFGEIRQGAAPGELPMIKMCGLGRTGST